MSWEVVFSPRYGGMWMEIINWCKSSSWADCQTVQEYKSEILVWFWGVFCFILQFPCLFATDNLVDSRLFQMEELRTERIQVIVTEVCAFPLQFYTCRRGSWDCKSGCCFGRSTRCFYQHFLAVISTNTSMVTPTALVFSSSVQSLFLQQGSGPILNQTNLTDYVQTWYQNDSNISI